MAEVVSDEFSVTQSTPDLHLLQHMGKDFASTNTSDVMLSIGKPMASIVEEIAHPISLAPYHSVLSSEFNIGKNFGHEALIDATTIKMVDAGVSALYNTVVAGPLSSPEKFDVNTLGLAKSALDSAMIEIRPSGESKKLIASASALIPRQDLLSGINLTTLALDHIQDAVKPLLAAQSINHQLLSNTLETVESNPLLQIANQSGGLLTDMLGDLLQVGELSKKLSTTVTQELFSDLTGINRSLEQVWGSHVSLDALSLDVSTFASHVALPTRTAARYMDSANAYVHLENGSKNLPVRQSLISKSQDEEILDQHLAGLNPTFVEMRLGARLALNHKGPDHLRHAATSMRELTRQVLQVLVPDEDLPLDFVKGKPNVKERVKIAIRQCGAGKGDADFAATMADAVLTMFDRLNKFTHENEQSTHFTRSVCLSAETTLLSILTLVGGDKSRKM